jgi:hypothetical protein
MHLKLYWRYGVWEVLQTDEFRGWFDALDEDAQEDILAAAMVLAVKGPTLGRPWVDHLKASNVQNLKELRVQSSGRPFRICFVFDSGRRAVFLFGGMKRGVQEKRFYMQFIRNAERVLEKYLEGLKNG